MFIVKDRSSRNKLLKCFVLSHYYKHVTKNVATSKRKRNCKVRKLANTESDDASRSFDRVILSESCAFVGEFDQFINILSERLIKSLHSCGYTKITAIQKHSIPKILDGCDVLIRSATGSGKTLTFLVPAIHRLICPPVATKITRKDGTRILIISPTRELSVQTAKIAEKIAKPFPWIVISSIKGGDSKKSEKARIRKGITIIVGTPGRILDHCETTSSFKLSNLDMFILDEADRLLDMGFEVKIKNIFNFSLRAKSSDSTENSSIQIVLTSATLSDSVMKLAEFCLRTKPVLIGMDDELYNLPATLCHEYVLTECKNKFMCLVALLLKYIDNNEKIIIFVSNCQSATYMHQLIKTISWPTLHNKSAVTNDLMESFNDKINDYSLSSGENWENFHVLKGKERPIVNVPVYILHGNMDHNDRLGYIEDFIQQKCAILVSTDVASRGLNLSDVDRVIQYDPPQQLEEYIHRSGRTARIGGKGNAILILMYHESQFTDELRKRGVNMKQIMEGLVWSYLEQTFLPKHLREFKGDIIGFIRNTFCHAVQSSKDMLECAKGAFKASIQSYKTYSKDLRKIFNFNKLHLGHYATSFCLNQKPGEIIKNPKADNKHTSSKGKPGIIARVKRQRTQTPVRPVSDVGLKAVEYLKSKNALLLK